MAVSSLQGAVVGIIANPRSGSDVRRLLTSAGSSTVEDKISILRRIIAGAAEAGAQKVLVTRDPFSIGRRATENLQLDIHVQLLDIALAHDERDSAVAAQTMREAGCAVLVSLGGDGTNRAIAMGWRDAPLIALSTGTNNAFPVHMEPTVAGVAAGLLAAGKVSLEGHYRQAKTVTVQTHDETDLALVDAVAVDDPYVGSLELFDPETMLAGVFTRADPTAIGFSGLAGTLHPCMPEEDRGVRLRFTPPSTAAGSARLVRAALAPGWFATVGLAESGYVELDEPVEVRGPCLLAFDGERSRRLDTDEVALLRVRRDGPKVVDVGAVAHTAGRTGAFVGHVED